MIGRSGWIAAIGALIVVAITVLVMKSVESGYVSLRSYTDDAGSLATGTSVRLNGIAIGYLDRLDLTESRDPKRKIAFVMKVKRPYLREIPDDSSVGVQASNLLGNYYIDITKGRSRTPVQPGAELQSAVALDPNRLLAEMAGEFQQIQNIFDRADRLITDVAKGQGNIGLLEKNGIPALNSAQAEAQKLSNAIQHGNGTLAKLGDLSIELDATERRANDLMAGIDARQGTAGKLSTLTGEMRQMSDEANKLTAELNSDRGPTKRIAEIQERFMQLGDRVQALMDRVNAGQGTAGQLVVNSQLSAALAGTSAQFQQLSKDIRANPRKFLSFRVRLF